VIDSHTHLFLCEKPTAELLEAAAAAGVKRMLNVGLDETTNAEVVRVAEAEASVFAGVGRHPNDATGFDDKAQAALAELGALDVVRALGETGLDFYRDWAPPDSQRRLFAAQLELAGEVGKPVVIHNRDADSETAAGLAGFDGTVILHCFSSPGLLDVALERGYYLSFAGNVTYPSAEELRAAARRVPAERILAETDSPYLAPVPRRGRPNEPANVVHTVAALAQTRGEDAAELAARIDANATAAFSLPVASPAP
jgi:TatD DNase family protein